MQVCFLLHGHKCFVTNELTLFQADTQYKALQGEHTPHQQKNSEGQLHAQDRLEGGENQFQCIKDVQIVHHWEPCMKESNSETQGGVWEEQMANV